MVDIKFNVPPYVDKAADYIQECVKNQKICGDGEYTKKCNAWIEERTGTGKCLLTTSCTHATELAALLCDIKPGDEVIMPSYTFVSTADAFVLRGAVPVFVDIRPDTMNIDETLIEDAITEKTKAGTLCRRGMRDGYDHGHCKTPQSESGRGCGPGNHVHL